MHELRISGTDSQGVVRKEAIAVCIAAAATLGDLQGRPSRPTQSWKQLRTMADPDNKHRYDEKDVFEALIGMLCFLDQLQCDVAARSTFSTLHCHELAAVPHLYCTWIMEKQAWAEHVHQQ